VLADNQEQMDSRQLIWERPRKRAETSAEGSSQLLSPSLVNESVGAGYIERNWPPAFKESGAWPLASLRQSFLNGALTRLLDPDKILRDKIVDFVGKGDFGLASGQKTDGTYDRYGSKNKFLQTK